MQRLQAAVALHNQGELDQAEAIYRNILTVDMNNFYALNFYGCICRERKRFDEGIDLLSRATSLQPGNPDAFYNLGNVLKDAERWNEAISCYEKTLGLRAEYPEALNNLGICLMEVERYEHSEIVLSRAVSMQPDFAGAWLNLGNTFKEQDKLEQAIGSYRKAIEEKPDFADAYLALGIFLKEDGEVEEAIRSYRKAIEVKPDFADAYLALGIVLKKGGEVEEAIRSYRKAIEVKPDFADVYLNLGNALKEEGEVEEAIRSYRKAIEVKPDFADVYLNLGIVLKGEGEVEEAIASYRKAIEVKPDFLVAYLNLGNVLEEEGELVEAIESYLKATEVKPDFADAYLKAAQAYRRLGLQEITLSFSSPIALDLLQKYIRLKPEEAKSIPTLGGINKHQILFANLNYCVGNLSVAKDCFESFFHNNVFLDHNASSSSSLSVLPNDSRACAEDIASLMPESCVLIPSFIGYKWVNTDQPTPYNNLFFAHIAKTAGHGFYDPLSIATTEYLGVTRAHMSSFILSPRFSSDEDVFALSAFLKDGVSSVSNSMIMFSSHGEIAHRHVIKIMEEIFLVKPSSFAFWRDPESRLMSCIKYLWRSGLSIRNIRQNIIDDDPSLCSSLFIAMF